MLPITHEEIPDQVRDEEGRDRDEEDQGRDEEGRDREMDRSGN